MSDALMNAVLAMDAYNRGYDASIELTGDQVGGATIVLDSSELGTITVDGNEIDRHEAIGFYALAYDYNGETIIAYRGTDYPKEGRTIPNPIPGLPDIPYDVNYGWNLGGGITASQQAQMAVEFYKAIAEEMELPGSDNIYLDANISLTGHSLGGGLAGFVGAISEQRRLAA
jgi:hypothetical protein